jgi:prevent-host-death family protein
MRKVPKTRASKKNRPVREVTISEFKLNCAALLDEVERTREATVVTRRGNPIASLVPPPLFGILKGRMEIIGDIISPIDVEWTGDAENLRKSPKLWRDGD